MARPRGSHSKSPRPPDRSLPERSRREPDAPAVHSIWVDRATIAVILLAGMVLLAIALGLHPVGDYYAESDFYGGYSDGARLIQHGRLDPSRYGVVGPVYELMLALVGLATGDLFAAGRIISVAATIGTMLLWLAMMRRRAGSVVALWGTLFLAANAVFLRYGYSATTDMLAIFLQSASLMVALEKRGTRWAAGAGLLAGLAVLTRYNSVYLVPAALIGYVWLMPPEGARRPRIIGAYLAGLAAILGPWLAYSLSSGDLPGSVLIRSYGFYWNPDVSRNVQDRLPTPRTAVPTYESLGALLSRDPLEFARHVLENIPRHVALDARLLIGVPVAVACAAGVVVALRDGHWKRMLPLWVPGAFLFATLVPQFYSERYALPLVPYYLSLAALAAGALRLGPPGPRASILAGLLALAPLGLSISGSIASQRLVMSQLPVEVLPAARALSRAAPQGAGVISRKGHIGYYAGLPVVSFPRVGTLRELADHGRRQGARYLYYSWYEAHLRPEQAFLLDTTAAVPGLSIVHVTDRNPSVLYAIGPEFGRDPAWANDAFARQLHLARALYRVLPDSQAWRHRTVLAVHELTEGRAREALFFADQATRAYGRDTLGWIIQGEAHRALGQASEAERAYVRALELDPGDLTARVGLGWTQLSLGREGEAARIWRPAVRLTHDPRTLEAMAQLYERLGDHEAARAAKAAQGQTMDPDRGSGIP